MEQIPLEQDPVCKMIKPRDQFSFSMEYSGRTYYFCSEDCRHMFSEMPRGYVGSQPSLKSFGRARDGKS